LLTLLALAESTIAPWSPAILLYAILCILIPVISGSCRFGSFKEAFRAHWRLLLLCLALLTAWVRVFSSPLFPLHKILPVFVNASALKMHVGALPAKIGFGLFLIIWAPVGEEFFYRGYLQGKLREKTSFIKAALIASFFFAIRHALHLFFFYPDIPWGAAFVWVVLAFGWGMIFGWLYERSSSLYLPVAAHFLANCISFI